MDGIGFMITIVIKAPGKEAYSKEIEDELEVYHQILGGYFEAIGFDKNQILLCDDEGKLKDLEPNLLVPGDVIVGTVIVVGTEGEEFRSLTPEEVTKAIKRLNDYSI